MKRGLVFALTALALVAGSSAVQAQAPQNVSLSLNLRYNDPADPTEGGKWYLMAKTDATFGLAGVSVNLAGIDSAGIALGNPTANAQYATMGSAVTGSIANGGNPYNGLIGGNVNVVWGFDVGTSVIANVGKGGAGNIATDPLRNTATWNNSALLVSGTFSTATRPTIVSAQANVLGAATAGTPAVAASNITTTVRGDSLNTKNLESPAGTEGLRIGDRNRDFAVNISTDILPALAAIGLPNQGWDNGDFNDTGTVNISQDILPALAQIGLPGMPPAVAAVPEPASVGLALFGLAAMGIFRKRFA